MHLNPFFNFIDIIAAQYVFAMQNDILIQFFIFVSVFGKWQIVLLLSMLVSFFLLWQKKRNDVYILWVALFFTGTSVLILKELITRERPLLGLEYGDSLYSFPSGHAALAVAFYGFFVYLNYRYVRPQWLRVSLTGLLILLVSLVCISRVYLGAHYATDVLASCVIGVGSLILSIRVLRR